VEKREVIIRTSRRWYTHHDRQFCRISSSENKT